MIWESARKINLFDLKIGRRKINLVDLFEKKLYNNLQTIPLFFEKILDPLLPARFQKSQQKHKNFEIKRLTNFFFTAG